MKTIEQKAKAYDEALERARKIHRETEFDYEKGMMEEIFPELQESEDERIRKDCIKYLDWEYQHCYSNEDKMKIEKCITWLEKQGAQTHAELSHSEVTKISDQELEPKFHGCEWITNGDYTWKILGIKPLDYILQSQDGNIVDDTISYVDEHFHLWSIQDAKDGDVLSFNDGHGNNCIELIKSITGKKIEFGFCLTNGNRYEVFDGITPYTNLVSREDATPATKEQCDALMKAMTDAGWEFDFDKKELKKIEQKTLDPDKVIKWLEENVPMFWEVPCSPNRIIDKFKGDFEI